MITRIKTL